MNSKYPAQAEERERVGEKERRGVLQKISNQYCMLGGLIVVWVERKGEESGMDASLGVVEVGTGARSVMVVEVVAMGEAMTTAVEG